MKKPKQNDNAAAFAERDDVCHVNGGVMEGGGQILRNTVALAAILNKKLHVFAIRANRPRGGGLRAQHLNGIDLVAQLYQAKTSGFEVGSCEITFEPRGMRADACNATADTKTAGSVCLLCQVSVPVCVFGAAPQMCLTLRGGTNATQAPPIDYFLFVLLPQVAKMGVVCSAKTNRRGFFPKGGGEVLVTVSRVAECLQPIRLTEQGAIVRVTVHGFHTAKLRGECGVAGIEERFRGSFGAKVEIVWQIEEVKVSCIAVFYLFC
jgi:RNA 3'-terminal phosphate cyclase (ATP)